MQDDNKARKAPGQVRDAILEAVKTAQRPLSVAEISDAVRQRLGDVPTSSVRSYLRLNTPDLFVRESRGFYVCAPTFPSFVDPDTHAVRTPNSFPSQKVGRLSTLFHADCFDWLENQANNSLHAVVTDPPYGLIGCPPPTQSHA